MSGIFSSPKAQPLPAPTPLPVTPTIDVAAQTQTLTDRQRARPGRAADFLTGALGDTTTTATSGAKLLGA